MGSKRAARQPLQRSRARAKRSSSWSDEHIVPDSEYERGTRIAGWMFCAMLVFMAVWTVVFQW